MDVFYIYYFLLINFHLVLGSLSHSGGLSRNTTHRYFLIPRNGYFKKCRTSTNFQQHLSLWWWSLYLDHPMKAQYHPRHSYEMVYISYLTNEFFNHTVCLIGIEMNRKVNYLLLRLFWTFPCFIHYKRVYSNLNSISSTESN